MTTASVSVPFTPNETQTTKRIKRIALVGNPNTGKTTLFNALTGLRHKVGNYPGVTVERKAGYTRFAHFEAEILDLPGTYSLAARSPDEMVVADILLGVQEGETPVDLVVAIVDAGNLTRNLYLVSQILELGRPLVVALNMMDMAEAKGLTIHIDGLSRTLGIPIIPMCAHKKTGINELRNAIDRLGSEPMPPTFPPPKFTHEIEESLRFLEEQIQEINSYSPHPIHPVELFRALIDEGGYTERRLVQKYGSRFAESLQAARKNARKSISLSAVEAQTRYQWIHQILDGHMIRPQIPVYNRTDTFDAVLTHPLFGLGIFLALMALLFQAVYSWAGPLMEYIDQGILSMSGWVTSSMPEGTLRSLVVDGMFAGVGTVLVFLPQIAILFFFIAVMEDCGYLPRTAFLMDRLFAPCGLSGKSFIPMLSSFACAVPGIMASRTIENRLDRFATILLAPLMSCSARLPVYLIFIAAFIPNQPLLGSWIGLQGFTLFVMYSLGLLIAAPLAWVLKKTLLKGKDAPFILELPTFQLPQFKTVALYVYERSVDFLLRAGTVIFCASVVVWALAYFPHPVEISQKYETLIAQADTDADRERLMQEESGEYVRHSYLGRMGKMIEPIVSPLGWDWRIGMAVLASFPAREMVVAALGTIFNLGADTDETSTDLRSALHQAVHEDGRPLFSVAVALSIMIFFALCCQCAATLAVIRKETLSWIWPTFAFTYMTVLAYLGAFAVYQIGCRLGLG